MIRSQFKLALCLLFATIQFASISTINNAVYANSISQVSSETRSIADSQIIRGSVIYNSSIGIDAADRLAKDKIFIGKDTKNNYIDLVYGNVLFLPEKNITVGTRAANIYIDGSAVVFVRESENGLAVYDLTHAPKKEVALTINKYKFNMQPGRMLVVTKANLNDNDQLNENFGSLSLHNVRQLNIGNAAINAFVADFSLGSALLAIEPLRRLATSNNPQDRYVVEGIIKDARLAKDIATKSNVTPKHPIEQNSNVDQNMSVQ